MTWLQQLADDLTARGIHGRDRRRIVAELRDHIECEPESVERLGDATELARIFADELATSRARRAAWHAFGALSTAAAVLAFSQIALGRAGGYPGFDHGLSLLLFFPALLGMFIAPQVALVSGTLAALRALRRRRVNRMPAAEIGLLARRTHVALAAGFATIGGIEIYVVDFSARLPAWWLGTVGGLGLASGGALACATHSLTGARTLVSGTPGGAGDVFDDLPAIDLSWLRRRSWRLGAAASLFVAAAMTAFEAHAERSLAEGLQRGIVEGVAAAIGFALLGRSIGVTSSRWRPWGALGPRTGLGELPGPSAHRVGDADRDGAERVVRASFAEGRLSVDELSTRLESIHAARTLGELRATVADLPDAR
jgi:uncharacterized protein DUF1707